MESKIKFDLNGQNEAVVSATIIFESEDVRDKVARTFYEGLGHYSNLAHVMIYPDNKIYGLKNVNGTILDAGRNGRMIQIKTFGGDMESTLKLCGELSTHQLEMLLTNIPAELEKRKSGTRIKE